MLISNEVRGALADKEKTVLSVSEKLREALSLSISQWSEYLEIRPSQYRQHLKSQRSFSALALFRLSDRLEANVSAFLTGQIDYEALVQIHNGNTRYINPRYLVAAYSKKFSMINTLNFIEKHRGAHLRTTLNRHFQISEDYWKGDFVGSINYRLITEVTEFLGSRGFSFQDFHSMGVHSGHTLRGSEIGNQLAASRSAKEVYDLLFGEVVFKMEHNCFYQLTELCSSGCAVEMRSNPEVADAFSLHHLGNRATCDMKRGILAAMPTFIGKSIATVRETHCVHRGDDRCRFAVAFPGPRLLS